MAYDWSLLQAGAEQKSMGWWGREGGVMFGKTKESLTALTSTGTTTSRWMSGFDETTTALRYGSGCCSLWDSG